MERSSAKPTGLTQTAGWQIGVRKTHPVDRSKAWQMRDEMKARWEKAVAWFEGAV